MNNRLVAILAVVVIGVVCLPSRGAADVMKVDVAVLTSDSLYSTKRTLHGAQNVIAQEYPDVQFHLFLTSDDPGRQIQIVDSIRSLRPRLIFTVGSSATLLAKENFDDIPIVFSAVKYPVLSGFVRSVEEPGSNITGASLDIPTDIQFAYFKKICPGIQRIGVLYTTNTESLIPEAQGVANGLGIELIALRVDSDKELPAAVDSLANMVQGVWSVADPNLFSPQSTRYILLNTVRKGIPFMGFSRYVVESGALFALDYDYKAVGIQAGAIANRVLEGFAPADIRVTTADVILFHYNENTAKRIRIIIPEELAAVAKEVYR